MIIINQSFVQLFALVFLTIKKNNYNFYILYKDKPLFIFKIILNFLNFITRNKYYLKNIYFFRSKFNGISDQEIQNKITIDFSRLFCRDKRLGGQIFVENLIRFSMMEYYAFDKIIRHFYFEDKFQNSGEEIESIFNILNSIREKERNIYNRIISIRGILGFTLFTVINIINFKINRSFQDKVSNRFLNYSSFTIHDFIETNNPFQKKDFIRDAVKFLSKELLYEKVIHEKDFLLFIFLRIAKGEKGINFKRIYFLFLKLLFNFFTSKKFLQSSANFIDRVVSILLDDVFLPKEFKVLCIDPIQGKSLPFLSELKSQRFEISFSSFSTGSFYTKSFSDFNGPYTTIFSQSPGFTEILKKSSFKGKIIEIDCYLSLFNNSKILINRVSNKDNSKIKIIVPENLPRWYFELSKKEYEDFSKILKELDTHKKIDITVKKKKEYSLIKSYLTNNFPENSISFKDPIRGYMGDFLDHDYILSLGLSSLGEKAAENFGLKYIIFDTSERSENQWKNLYANSKLKPLFAKDIEEIKNFLFNK